MSCALTRGVNLTWLSEPTGVADGTLRKHYGKFIHADARDALELAKIDSDAMETVQFVPRLPLAAGPAQENPWIYNEKWWSRRDLNLQLVPKKPK